MSPDSNDAGSAVGERTDDTAAGTGAGNDSQTGSAGRSFLSRHRRALGTALLGAAAAGFAYYVLPEIVGLGPTLQRLRSGNPWWLGAGIPLEAISIAALVVLFHVVFSRENDRIRWRASYQITMAGGAATKLFAAAGSGGVAMTVWALRASGTAGGVVAEEMLSYEMLNYSVYMLALIVCGFGLWSGLFAGGSRVGLTLIPAVFAVAVIATVLLAGWLASPLERFILAREQASHGRLKRLWQRLASAVRSLDHGLSGALAIIRGGDRSWLAAVPAWGFDIAVLWASFRAFGHSPPAAVLVMGYYVGTLGNALPLPAGIGGVEGGMIGAFLGFGVNGSLAVLAVLGYRTITYWLPLLPEGLAYLGLRRTVGDWRDGATIATPSSGRQPNVETAQGSA